MKAQCNLDRQTANISALPSGNVSLQWIFDCQIFFYQQAT